MTTDTIQTLRSFRIAGMAVFDWTASFLGAWVIGRWLLHLEPRFLPWAVFILAWVAFGVLVHAALGIPTMFGYYLGVNPKPPNR